MTFCYFCFRPSTGRTGYEESGVGMSVPCCNLHYSVAQDLVYGNVLRRLAQRIDKASATPRGDR